MPRQNEAWDRWYEDKGVVPGKSQRQVKCRFCAHIMSYRGDRMLSHLGYKPTLGGPRDVSTCRMVPRDIRVLFEECVGVVPDHGGFTNEDPQLGDDMPMEPVLSQSVNDEREPLQMSQTTQPSGPRPQDTPPRELRQLSISEGFNTSTKQYLDGMWATAFYEANIPFNVVRHPAFISAVRETARHRMPAYTPPSYNAIRTKLLTAKKVELEKQVKEKLGNSIEKYGVTICCDGWDNVQNRPLLNVIQCGTKGDVFLGTIDTTGNHKDHNYVAQQIRPFVEMVGAKNVVQVCTDNAPVMVSASRDIMQINPHMYVQGCAAHCLDLLLEDWGKEEWVKILVKKARAICVFIKNHHASQAIFRRLSPNLSIRLPVETRFATNFIMIERLLQVRNALERMVVEEDWFFFIGNLRRRSNTAYMKALAVRRFIRSDGFWNTCENFLYMVIPIVKGLRVFDGKAPAMGLAWRVMHDLETHVRGFTRPPFSLSADLGANAMLTFQNRWKLMLTDLHWAGAMLNPILRDWAPLHEHELSRTILNRVLRRLTPDEDTYVQVLNQYQDFLENRGPFIDSTDPTVHVAPIHEWWDAMGGGAKALQTIARRILGQVCSASACERNWSMYSFVHNKVRNRLKHSRAEDLVYIYTNSRLLRHRRGPKPAQWYGLNEVHSDDDLDGEDHDDEGDIDPNENGGNVDNDDVDNIDFDLDDLDSDNHNSDGDDDGGDGNLGVFDFDEGNVLRHNEARPGDHEGPIEGPSFGSLYAGTENVGNEVDSLQPQSNSPPFGQGDEGDDALCANEQPNVQHEPVQADIHFETTMDSPESNHQMDIETPCVGEAAIVQANTMERSVSTSELHSQPEPQHRPLTRSIANTSRVGVTCAIGVGATLVAIRNVSGNVAQGVPRRQSIRRSIVDNITNASPPSSVPLSRSQFMGRGGLGIGVGGRSGPVQGIGTRGAILGGGSLDRDGTRVMDGVRSRSETEPVPHGYASNGSNRDQLRLTRGNDGGRQRTTRGVKRRKTYRGSSLPFAAEDYDESEGRPHLDENGIRDAEGSRRTKKLVVTRDEDLRLRSVSPQTDDDLSTDDSLEDPRCAEANDPTVRI